jgi:hypothetical protein
MIQIVKDSKNLFINITQYAQQEKYQLKNTQQLDALDAQVEKCAERARAQILPPAIDQQVKWDIEASRELVQECKAYHLSKDWLDQPLKRWNGVGVTNLVCPELPCAYDNSWWSEKLPRIGVYTNGYPKATNYGKVRLNEAQLSNIPESVARAIGDRSGKKIDYFFCVDSVASLKEIKQKQGAPLELNVLSHYWAHDHHEWDTNVTKEVSMGIYEANGVYSVDTQDGVSFESQKELPVICHPGKETICLSPNNAHIGIKGDAPFSSHWLVCKLDNRVIVTHQVLVHEYHFEKLFHNAFQSGSLGKAFEKLNGPRKNIFRPLLNVAESYEKADGNGDVLFNALPSSLKNSAYYQTWLEKWTDKTKAAPSDFGGTTFHNCSNQDKAALLCTSYYRLLEDYGRCIDKMQVLFAPPKTILPPTPEKQEKLRLLTPIVDAFKAGRTDDGFALFEKLADVHKNGIYQYVWEFALCPRNYPGDFGKDAFYGSKDIPECHRYNDTNRAKAVLSYLHSI